MAITFYKSLTDYGGAISTELTSGAVGELLPEITKEDQVDGVLIHRKFYLANDAAAVVPLTLVLELPSAFTAIVFKSTGDAQVVGDLTGSETNESPVSVNVPATGHVSFWLKITVAPGSTEIANYNKIDMKYLLRT